MIALPHTHKLKAPVRHGQEDIAELTFTRAPVAGDLMGVRMTEMDKTDNIIQVIARLSNVPPVVIKQLGLEDFVACAEVVTGFLPNGRETGSGPAG